ncbi:MAG: isochorismatase family protein [Actinobacteria bacterium]|nr:isochorismatase family protein [Actinomycetota bacterium]
MPDGIHPQRMPAPRLTRPAVVLIDAQPAFLDIMAGPRFPLVLRLEKLLLMAAHLELPTLATFERPQQNGRLPVRCEAVWPAHGTRHEKHTYDCCGQQEIVAAVEALHRRRLLIAGAETDVCVLQSVLSLLDRGHEVFLLEDCLFSSERHVAPALRRMYSSGAVPCTLKTAFYELMRSVRICSDPASGGPHWERLIPAFGEPELWPHWRPASGTDR